MASSSKRINERIGIMEDENGLSKWRKECGEDAYIAIQDHPREYQSPSIFKVPKMLKRENDVIYTPQVISLGPHHFLAPHLAETETEKSIIIQRAIANVIGQEDFNKRVLTKCKDAYGNHAEFNQNLDDKTFSLMMFRDTSFLLVFLAVFIVESEKTMKDGSSKSSDPFDGLTSSEGLKLDVMKDVVKLENQIPLCALEALYAFVGNPEKRFEDFVASICSYYSPFWIQSHEAYEILSPFAAKATHLLHCIHEVSINAEQPSRGSAYEDCSAIAWIKKHTALRRTVRSIRQLCGRVCNKAQEKKHGKRDRTAPLFVTRVLPSAVNLGKAGVKFRAFKGGIKHIRFDREDCTLYLPVMKIGPLTETIMRNLIAFELSSSVCEKKAITSFARLLDELIEGPKDVELMRKNKIFVNWIGRDEKAVNILQNLRGSTWQPYFKPINDAKKSLCELYDDRKWHILWSEFLATYCSKPWVLVSAIAATLLLFMTAAQVFCLFYTCN